MDKKTEEKIQQLQLLEQNLQNFSIQRQNFQAQSLEIDNALREIKTNKQVYKIVGPIMILSNQEDIDKELNDKKKLLDLRIKNLEKQERDLTEKATKLRNDVIKEIKK